MKLVFYSGGDDKDNRHLDKTFVELIGKKNPVVTFIPSSSYLAEQEFKVFVKHYSKFIFRLMSPLIGSCSRK
jgi:hypothetical protein